MKSLRNRKKERGVATILVVGVLLFFLLFFFVLAIDFAFVYTVRGQLQNAADAAALAGASELTNVFSDTLQTAARDEAKEFAAKNFAGGSAVVLEDSDIEVGFWTGSAFISGITPVNAIKVSAKRIAARSNAVRLYFGHIVGWPTMDIDRIAIASRPARADAPVALCYKSCPDVAGIINATGTRFKWTQGSSEVLAFALTDFSAKSVSTPSVIEFTCGKVFDTCYIEIDTLQGKPEPVLRQFRCAFLNPLYDSDHKTCVIDANTNNIADPAETEVPCTTVAPNLIVSSWSPLIPLLDETACTTPTYQPPSPYEITGYARAKIVDLYLKTDPTGSGNNCACDELDEAGYTYSEPPRFQTSFPPLDEPAIVINALTCVACNDPDINDFIGKSAFLVR